MERRGSAGGTPERSRDPGTAGGALGGTSSTTTNNGALGSGNLMMGLGLEGLRHVRSCVGLLASMAPSAGLSLPDLVARQQIRERLSLLEGTLLEMLRLATVNTTIPDVTAPLAPPMPGALPLPLTLAHSLLLNSADSQPMLLAGPGPWQPALPFLGPAAAAVTAGVRPGGTVLWESVLGGAQVAARGGAGLGAAGLGSSSPHEVGAMMRMRVVEPPPGSRGAAVRSPAQTPPPASPVSHRTPHTVPSGSTTWLGDPTRSVQQGPPRLAPGPEVRSPGAAGAGVKQELDPLIPVLSWMPPGVPVGAEDRRSPAAQAASADAWAGTSPAGAPAEPNTAAASGGSPWASPSLGMPDGRGPALRSSASARTSLSRPGGLAGVEALVEETMRHGAKLPGAVASVGVRSVQEVVAEGGALLPSHDGFLWHRYGKKAIKDAAYPRVYYRCAEDSCSAKKFMQVLKKDTDSNREGDKPSSNKQGKWVTAVSYEHEHNHPAPRPSEAQQKVQHAEAQPAGPRARSVAQGEPDLFQPSAHWSPQEARVGPASVGKRKIQGASPDDGATRREGSSRRGEPGNGREGETGMEDPRRGREESAGSGGGSPVGDDHSLSISPSHVPDTFLSTPWNRGEGEEQQQGRMGQEHSEAQSLGLQRGGHFLLGGENWEGRGTPRASRGACPLIPLARGRISGEDSSHTWPKGLATGIGRAAPGGTGPGTGPGGSNAKQGTEIGQKGVSCPESLLLLGPGELGVSSARVQREDQGAPDGRNQGQGRGEHAHSPPTKQGSSELLVPEASNTMVFRQGEGLNNSLPSLHVGRSRLLEGQEVPQGEGSNDRGLQSPGEQLTRSEVRGDLLRFEQTSVEKDIGGQKSEAGARTSALRLFGTELSQTEDGSNC